MKASRDRVLENGFLLDLVSQGELEPTIAYCENFYRDIQKNLEGRDDADAVVRRRACKATLEYLEELRLSVRDGDAPTAAYLALTLGAQTQLLVSSAAMGDAAEAGEKNLDARLKALNGKAAHKTAREARWIEAAKTFQQMDREAGSCAIAKQIERAERLKKLQDRRGWRTIQSVIARVFEK